MLRVLIAGSVVLLAVALALVGYDALILGTGLAGALADLHNYWRDVASGSDKTQTIRWVALVVVGVIVGWRISRMPKLGKY